MGYESLSTVVVLVIVAIIIVVWLPVRTANGMKRVDEHRQDRYSPSLHIVDAENGRRFGDIKPHKAKGAAMPASTPSARLTSEHIAHVRELRRAAGTSRSCLPQSAREGAMITVESFVGRGGEWNYWSTRAADCLPIAAILCWLGDFLAGTERRTLQSSPEAMALAARWQAELASPFAQPADCVQRPARTVSPSAPRRAAQQVQNPRWQSILAVLATV